MAFHFYRVFRRRLEVVSSYRSYSLQSSLFAGYMSESGPEAFSFSALPGHSEHQLGLAVDLFTATTADVDGYDSYYDWLRHNAHQR
ncbi:D-alanyl-D-alanine carboxypeptidase family protein [Patescibacteria group bacterium]|nr:D-alanyl-D-alanine carboxypeptidase family protein [Patescibacteria group bacterium]